MWHIVVNNQQLESVQSVKLLGVHIKCDLKWDLHVDSVCSKASKRLYALRTLKRSGVSAKHLRSVYVCFVRPVLEYASPVWHSSLTSSLHDDLEQIQRRATKIMLPSRPVTRGGARGAFAPPHRPQRSAF